MATAVRKIIASVGAAAVLSSCGELAAPPPAAVDDDPRSLRATDPDAAGPDAPDTSDVQDADPAGSAAGTADVGRSAGEGDATSPPDAEDDELPPDRPQVHPDRYLARWLDHHLPRAAEEQWQVTEAGSYDWDLAGVAQTVEPHAEYRAELERARADLLALAEPDRPIDVGYVAIEFSGGFDGLIWHLTSSLDGEAVRVIELAEAVAGYVHSSYRTHIEDAETIGGVHVFHVTQGAGGVETRIWRQGPRTVFVSGPYGVGMEEIARATIEANP